ncbi:MAG: lysophospholipid acyltransferase family protein [Bacteroidetes bacterium]|nr:lysophospholipid acyltransferase family protein [Bacteroidota bacterium]
MKYKNIIKFFPFYLLSIAPIAFLYLLSSVVYFMLYHLLRYRRKIVNNNLSRAFPDKSEQEIRSIEKKFYRHFCDIWFESIKVLTISKTTLFKRFRVLNPGLIEKYFDENRSVILYTAHQGNWEWLIFLPLFLPHHVLALYQRQSSSYFDELMKLIRERFGVNCVESDKGYRTILNFKQRDLHTLTYILGDQSPKKNMNKHWVQFMNRETAFLIGADRIAKKSNQVVVFAAFKKPRRGYYELEFTVIEEAPTQNKHFEIIDRYAGLLEKTITESPELYLWSHNKWKLTNNGS